ncbi:MAG TPA: enoyl-CoA hydratase/isomerase family protein [Candidatus Binataceae bacterium]|nr:enoyl-CoA hydratase/isomerase family protein [Candidatus Binataceae bacterium]
MDYNAYQHLDLRLQPGGVMLVTMNRPEVLNATNARLHWELSHLWRELDEDPAVRVVVITGAGRGFSAGGDLELLREMSRDRQRLLKTWREASDIVYNLLACNKPVISAINGPAVGAGLAVALLADISIVAENVRLSDGHLRFGVAAGDHAVILWPLLCGMAKAKYYLLTADFIDGREAERIGLVSLCVPAAELLPKAMEIAGKLAAGPQEALEFTKRALNNWIRAAGPAFDASLALEMLGFLSPDASEGITALAEKRPPQFKG